jgi:hypothetical protein
MAAPQIHVLDKQAYNRHHLVTLPADPPAPLGPSSIRIQSKTIGLTTNNFSYARGGHILGWWDIYPPPSNTPAPFNDPKAYGSIAGWGHAEILESTVPGIEAGQSVYGYVPIGTLPWDFTIEQTGLKDQIVVTNPHRQHVWKIYNRLRVLPPISKLAEENGWDSIGWESIDGLFGTGYNLSRHGFAWKDENRVHPGGEAKGDWSAEQANLDDSTVVILSASGKTAMGFAYSLRETRPKEHQPRTIIGVCSAGSRDTVEKSGFYDKIVSYDDFAATKDDIDKSGTRKAVLFDFGGRPGTRETWNETFEKLSTPYLFVSVGGEVKVQNPDEATARMMKFFSTCQVNASELREKGIQVSGDKYFEDFYSDWEKFKERGAIPGTRIQWGEGMKGWTEGWEALCNDQIGADVLLIYKV